ncbi:MAG: hypothetical protein UT11_C0030G0010 [Berkelbacteria bacterium GW2011_GWA2_38_9]|uniref:Uncharacterized protein n=1 Tax=Berkelbacteria bacterium GW2011_GWA2_38_9 TaxID=1618334 RepID=A0A0G0LMR9_9BACT|nr:MAG: hypothetical protein UT11_C0030G0010 [Berkelbacteria bacterium GW2011_GWA2_38_9]
MKIHSIQTTAKFYRSLSKLPIILQEEVIIKKEVAKGLDRRHVNRDREKIENHRFSIF